MIKKESKLRKDLEKIKNPLKLKSAYQEKMYWERLQGELVDEAMHLNKLSKAFVSGSKRPKMKKNLVQGKTLLAKDELIIEGQQVMQSWQKKFMQTVARASDPAGKDVLEIGYGLGIASKQIQKLKPRKHTIIECNPHVFEVMQKWADREKKKGANIELIQGTWQDALPRLGKYESILFDPYPFDEAEFQSRWYDDGNFDAHFFPHAAKHLTKGGTFAYFTNEIDSLSRRHQHQLFEHFSRIEIEVVKNLKVPENCQYWWAPQMAVVRAVK